MLTPTLALVFGWATGGMGTRESDEGEVQHGMKRPEAGMTILSSITP